MTGKDFHLYSRSPVNDAIACAAVFSLGVSPDTMVRAAV